MNEMTRPATRRGQRRERLRRARVLDRWSGRVPEQRQGVLGELSAFNRIGQKNEIIASTLPLKYAVFGMGSATTALLLNKTRPPSASQATDNSARGAILLEPH
jgi:hypothetical protein